MSGGSFNYLFTQEQYSEEDLRTMAAWLRGHGMHRAADETLTFISPRADEALIGLWKAAEWCESQDWGFDYVVEAHDYYSEARDRPMGKR